MAEVQDMSPPAPMAFVSPPDSLQTWRPSHGRARLEKKSVASSAGFRNTKSSSKPLTPATVLVGGGSGVNDTEVDQAMRRVLRTPRVFQSSGGSSNNRCRELRANLLPSILRTPSETAASIDSQVDVEIDGEFYKHYKEKMERRAQDENKVSVFLEHDPALNQPEEDPQQMVTSTCTVFKDLVADRLSKFRRPREGFVNTESDLPFTYSNQNVDIEELSDILTLDLERCEFPFKGTVKRPGFTSLQLASRVPLIIRDPLASGDQGKLKSKKLPNDVHMIRLDLQPGEVRHVAYSLGSAEFKQTKLASRMSALVSPEEGVLAELVRTLRSKESDVRAVTSVLNDLLRDLTHGGADTSPELSVETAVDEEVRASRLEAIAKEPRRTLKRLVASLESLSSLVAPLMPSLAHALDRIALICVRESDRTVAKCHADYENLVDRWATAEKERLRFSDLIDRMGGKLDGSGGVELRNRAVALETELGKQEQLYANLLQEKNQQQTIAEESARLATSLRNRVQQLEASFDRLCKGNKEAAIESLVRSSAAPTLDSNFITSPHEPDTQVVVTPAGGTKKQMTTKGVGNRSSPGRSHAQPANSRDKLLAFAVHKSVQTDTEPYFDDDAPLKEELLYNQHHDVLCTASRLFYTLCRYDWNNAAIKFLLMPPDHEFEDGRTPAMNVISKLIETRQSRAAPAVSPNDAGGAVATHLVALHKLQVKVREASQKANENQLEEVILRLQDVAKDGFDKWVERFMTQLDPDGVDLGDNHQITPNRLWEGFLQVVDTHGLQQRVQELESHLSSLLPLAERQGGEAIHGDNGIDGAFWKRVMKKVRQSAVGSNKAAVDRQGSKTSGGAVAPKSIEDGEIGEPSKMDLQSTLAEIDDIWGAAITYGTQELESSTRGKLILPARRVLQGAIKSFYLRKTGRSKYVEASMVSLCSAVLVHCMDNMCIAFFALLADIQHVNVLEPRFPTPLRQTGFHFPTDWLDDLPSDAPVALASVILEIRAACPLSRSAKTMRGEDPHDIMLPTDLRHPFEVCLSAAGIISERSRIANKYLELLLFGFAEFIPAGEAGTLEAKFSIQQKSSSGPSDLGLRHTVATRRPSTSNIATSTSEVEAADLNPEDAKSQKSRDELNFVSQIIYQYVKKKVENDETRKTDESEATLVKDYIQKLWKVIVTDSSSLNNIRRSLGLASVNSTVVVSRIAEILMDRRVVNLDVNFVSRALLIAGGFEATTDPTQVEVGEEALLRLTEAWQDCGNTIVCRESSLLHICMWALASERQHEVELMGQLFELYDESGDGWLQFEEFTEFISAISPHLSVNDAEDIFLSGIEELQGDMTKDVFMNLAMRHNFHSNVDALEQLVLSKRHSLYGAEGPAVDVRKANMDVLAKLPTLSED